MSDDEGKKERGLETLAIQTTMSTKDGRHFMWRILEQSGIFTDNFDENPIIHARNAGSRSLGLWLDNELKDAALGSYMTMIKEHHDG